MKDNSASARMPIRLRRDGQRPLCFSGSLIARHDGRVKGASLWHELGLYRGGAAYYAVEIVARRPDRSCSNGLRVRCHAAIFETLDAALSTVENHDPSRDICPGVGTPGVDYAGIGLAPISIAAQTAALSECCGDVRRRYRIGAGLLLYRACLMMAGMP